MAKPIGVLGGMGPLATKAFFGMIIDNTDAKSDQEHMDLIILNHAGTPDRTEAILSGDTGELFESLLADCVFLENSGACLIAIPCNTTHFLIDKLQENIKVQIVNMVREAAGNVADIAERGAKVGILATDGTIKLGLYQKEMEARGLVPFVPSAENQKRVMRIIYDGIKNGGEIDYGDFLEIEKELVLEGCDFAVMGCTELSCFMELNRLPEDFYFDAMKSLALAVIRAAGGAVKK